jgi:hypothetical protein
VLSVFYVHWDEDESRERAAGLRKAGFSVRAHWKASEYPRFRSDSLPKVFLISLDRLPSHGRAIAEWVWEAKTRRSIPIIFSGGAADKVKATRALFPGAHYCKTGDEVAAIERLLRGDVRAQ